MHTYDTFLRGISLSLLCCLLLAASSCNNGQLPPQTTTKRFTIEPGDTLYGNLEENGIPGKAGEEIVKNLSKVFNLRSCRPGDYYEIKFDPSGQWKDFNYCPSGLSFYSVKKSSVGVVAAEKRVRSVNKTLMTASGRITTSLWEAMSAKNIPPEMINDFADIFAWQIDFLTEPRVNDTYKVIWEKFSSDDGVTVSGRILAAQYIASGQANNAVLFEGPDGQENYYSPDGKSLRRSFLKAPLQYRRISSFFTKKRFHPVLKRFRPHLGIDYAAPRGTPVSSVGDGTVVFAGRKGGFGKYIQIHHTNGYTSSYGHLHGFAKGMYSGSRVRQGQVIGYVGSTGLSTGPHLDFRITKDGRYINFLTLKFPPARNISGTEKPHFQLLTKSVLSHLASIRLE